MEKQNICDIMIKNKKFRKLNQKIMWKKVEYSQNQIKKAGKAILKDDISEEEKKQALDIINNWRASHAFPLNTITCHLKRMTSNDTVVVQRLKRLDSITGKLKRMPNMSLCTMQDLGGCRVIVNTIDDVYKVVEDYKKSRKRHILKSEDDYIAIPKMSGYRSYHMVYQYHSDRSEDYNHNMLIEIQARTKLQHIWATAVETMGIYTKNALKAGSGDEDILRFFSLVSSLIAIKEEMPIVPGTPNNMNELIEEIRDIDRRKNVIYNLSAIRVAIEHVKERKKKGYYILILNYDTKQLRIITYKPSQINEATDFYNHIEAINKENTDAVLVSATSFASLRAAYPNYFSDIKEFIDLVNEFIK